MKLHVCCFICFIGFEACTICAPKSRACEDTDVGSEVVDTRAAAGTTRSMEGGKRKEV
jgi:hypothetical protein